MASSTNRTNVGVEVCASSCPASSAVAASPVAPRSLFPDLEPLAQLVDAHNNVAISASLSALEDDPESGGGGIHRLTHAPSPALARGAFQPVGREGE